MTTQYTLSSSSWTGDSLVLRDAAGRRMLTFPIIFLTEGHVASWDYIYEVLGMCFKGAVNLTTLDGTLKTRTDRVTAGTLVVTSDDAGVTPVRGPRFKEKFRAPADRDDNSTMSHSSRSSVNQSPFRTKLTGRDAVCLVTDSDPDRCTAAHILPISRPEYYVEVLGLDQDAPLYSTAYGLLLRKDIHSDFDQGRIAFYPHRDRLIVHVFDLDPSYRQYHGKILRPDRFRAGSEAPSVDLLRFHYRHCCIKYMRGYAAFMNIPQGAVMVDSSGP
ncbi:hypothetical protein BCV69DRAFT_299454 [Microstroma glucosiphilum]|uniref:HNH nuclease domain-containing protein n=1 Tax=Pseudomicrostroma glucosiphilum TaxID=1684307 RepID=A0A316U662_9BASI|nr:hypothetical protein BCV69DRAFT_299454 [Pseudomicrostroma glucosiphilum]PWN20318.1 hypothetical protein BCV69DRAFT_299454 [Pseudomicrostroma glucosiphilum]